MLDVKVDRGAGCTFLGKGIVGRPEMGVIEECREVTFDEWDFIEQDWKDCEVKKLVYRTDTGYVFDEDDIFGADARFEIEQYAPNWRKHLTSTGLIRWSV